MDMDEVIAFTESLGGVLTLRPRPGDGSPEVSWGDAFCYYAPDGVVPRTQPFATIVTQDHPGDEGSRLDRPGAFRVNVAAGTDGFRRWAGRHPRDPDTDDVDPSTPDVLVAHPVYGHLGWLAVVDPGPRTGEPLRDLLRTAHALARARYERRTAAAPH
ncbi:DUF6194 family protein [Geodermatophilus sp. DSM 45219]|uniref:DUF6194 family protein n=1 Tax=Geodermatophilus sp. DSM 45219 TaxID=1881103 RepID=UPI00088FE6D9|nr:DUF6194 family protein [Geodermatophilus sp. DSM 45219]SDN71154.1 hypothetical protein SAMN05428965_1263 [Geodermatophilus sp. DSM 45219]